MPSLKNRRNTLKKNDKLIERFAFSFLYIFSIATFYLLWVAYINHDIAKLNLYLMFYLIYIILFYLIVNDLYNNYDFFKTSGNIEGTKLLEETHYFCADPVCSRCGGWYWGLVLSITITLGLKDSVISILNIYKVQMIYFIPIWTIIFLITTPFHGALNFLMKKETPNNNNKKLKLILGLISGLSMSFIAIGILSLIAK